MAGSTKGGAQGKLVLEAAVAPGASYEKILSDVPIKPPCPNVCVCRLMNHFAAPRRAIAERERARESRGERL